MSLFLRYEDMWDRALGGTTDEKQIPHWFANFAYVLIGFVFKVLFRYRVDGRENLRAFKDRCGAVVVSNHTSFLDVVLMYVAARPSQFVRLMGRDSLFGNAHGLAGQILSRVGAFPIKRDSADRTAIKRAAHMLKGNQLVGILPEGTRRGKGSKTPEIHSGAAFIAKMGKAPILPMCVREAENVKRKGERMHFPKITVEYGKPLVVSDFDFLPKEDRLDGCSWYAMREVFALHQRVPREQVDMVALFPDGRDFTEVFAAHPIPEHTPAEAIAKAEQSQVLRGRGRESGPLRYRAAQRQESVSRKTLSASVSPQPQSASCYTAPTIHEPLSVSRKPRASTYTYVKGSDMEVIRSKNAGACYGVQRALDLALKASEGDGSAFTLGPLIHNPQVVANLEARGVLAVKEPEQATHGAIIIRSHGVTPAVRRSVEARGLPVIDATCPHVARAQKAAATLAEECGYVVVVGEEGHPEVEGLVAYAHEAGAQVHVAETAADLPSDLPEHVGVVVQTTQTRDALDDVLEGIRAQGVAAQVKDTVCTATRQRQQAAAELAGQVDAIVVIGGRNSANTTHLAEICAAECPRTHHIESAAELDPAWFAGCTSVGVTAGASTPDDQIDEVVQRLERM